LIEVMRAVTPLTDAGRLDLKPWPASVAEKRFLARFAVLFAAASA